MRTVMMKMAVMTISRARKQKQLQERNLYKILQPEMHRNQPAVEKAHNHRPQRHKVKNL